MEETFETGSNEKCLKDNRSRQTRQTSRDQHNNALMMGKGTSDERF